MSRFFGVTRDLLEPPVAAADPLFAEEPQPKAIARLLAREMTSTAECFIRYCSFAKADSRVSGSRYD
jgi:hypothetical protein